jgi:hypothetical protein
MKKPLSFLSFLLISLSAFTQVNLKGKVVDAQTREPLVGASVFAQNTTRGTITNAEGKFQLYLEKGGYELVITFTGYNSRNINVTGSETEEMMVELEKADNSMSEVVIRSSSEVAEGWDIYGRFFLDHFLGATPFSDSCFLLNAPALKFLYYKRNDRLKVLSGEPLLISNKALGYEMRYELDSFVHFFQTGINSYRGRCLYSEMTGSEEEIARWKANRRKAYQGSKLHFLRSFYDSTLQKEGFTVDLLMKNSTSRFGRLLNPYDSTYYLYVDSTDDVELWWPRKAGITFNRKAPEKEYLQQMNLPSEVKVQISYVDLGEPIVIKPNGYFFSQRSWVNQGYWSWKNLADQLPYDYEPD